MPVRFGVFAPQGWRLDLTELADPIAQYEAMTAVARAADALAVFDSIWLYDHFHTVPRPTLQTTFEAWTSTAALARDTSRVHIGQMVTCAGYRAPALLAKMASTVDVLSHGRLYCGLGAGWYEQEWRAYGYGFPETRRRMRAFAEACAILTKMWTEEYPEFAGEMYTIDKPINEPKGVRQPHPALWIGGSGEQVTLKLVARYGDACNIGGEPAQVERKLAVLRRHCDTLGRDYESIIRSSNLNIFPLAAGEDAEKATAQARKALGVSLEEFANAYPNGLLIATAERIAERLQQQLDAGANYLIFYLPGVAYDHTRLQIMAEEVLPRFLS
jgi:F420-dependent oxidoreductase-like protein